MSGENENKVYVLYLINVHIFPSIFLQYKIQHTIYNTEVAHLIICLVTILTCLLFIHPQVVQKRKKYIHIFFSL